MIFTDERHERIWADYFQRQLAALQAEDEHDRTSIIVSGRHPTDIVTECQLVLMGKPHGILSRAGP